MKSKILEVPFAFTAEENFASKTVRVFGIKSTDGILYSCIPVIEDTQSVEEFLAQQITVSISRVMADSVTFTACAPNGASGVYKFKITITYGI